jgi:hypothetical protein
MSIYGRLTESDPRTLGTSIGVRNPNAKPPRFLYEWTSDRVLVMTYQSERALLIAPRGGCALMRGGGERCSAPWRIGRIVALPRKRRLVRTAALDPSRGRDHHSMARTRSAGPSSALRYSRASWPSSSRPAR